MFCPNCGKNVDNDKNFCPACGKKLRKQGNSAEISERKPGAKGGFNSAPYLIAAVVIVFIISASAFFVTFSLISKPNDNAYISSVENEMKISEIETALEPETEAVTETEVQPATEEVPPAAAEPEIEPPSKYTTENAFDDSYGVYLFVEELAYDLINPFYSYAWVQTTNNHDSSYVDRFSLDGSPVRYTLGQEYWQERPTKSFKRIYDVQIHKISNVMWLDNPTCDSGFDVCVSYSFELYDSETGKTTSKTELVIANVSVEYMGNYTHALYMNKHTWVNDVPLGTTVTEDDFSEYLEPVS
ncbi:MAG: zinc-ribbon domain-containing protein [Eubacterium sp.]|nr:zinc-ribbon domain-containing protein [Eubacterium sp.]